MDKFDIFCMGCIIGLMAGALLMQGVQISLCEKEAVKHGAAHYNSTNAVFEWNK